jgi:hypothetical protein
MRWCADSCQEEDTFSSQWGRGVLDGFNLPAHFFWQDLSLFFPSGDHGGPPLQSLPRIKFTMRTRQARRLTLPWNNKCRAALCGHAFRRRIGRGRR